jgi:hypothetical protein
MRYLSSVGKSQQQQRRRLIFSSTPHRRCSVLLPPLVVVVGSFHSHNTVLTSGSWWKTAATPRSAAAAFGRSSPLAQRTPSSSLSSLLPEKSLFYTTKASSSTMATNAATKSSDNDCPQEEGAPSGRPTRKRAARMAPIVEEPVAAKKTRTKAGTKRSGVKSDKAKERTGSPSKGGSLKAKKTDEGVDGTTPKPKPANKKPPAHQVLTERDEIPKLWDKDKAAANGSYSK